MEQKQRNRIAWIMAIILAPVLIYLLATNLSKGGKRSARTPVPASADIASSGDAVPIPVQMIQPRAVAKPALSARVAAQQRQIAARLPRRNPFNDSLQSAASRPASVARPAEVVELVIRVTGIVSRPGSQRMAMINGKLLSHGDRVGPWTIVKVNANSVQLSNGSRQMTVNVK